MCGFLWQSSFSLCLEARILFDSYVGCIFKKVRLNETRTDQMYILYTATL